MPFLLAESNTDELSYGFRELDGDMQKVTAIDTSKDGGTTVRIGTMVSRGRAVHPEHMPTRIMREGPKRFTPDVMSAWSMPIVDERFREVVEAMEPSVHQFFKVNIFWNDGSPAAERYFLVVCNRLDSIHPELTTMRFNGVLWEPVPGEASEVVFDRAKFQGKHLWRDKHLISRPLVSHELARALVEAGVTGLQLIERPEAG